MVSRAVTFAVPGDLATPTGGYAYDRRIIAELGRLGWNVDVIDLGEGFPFPAVDVAKSAGDMLNAVPAQQPIVVDGLALGVLPQSATLAAMDHPLVALVHHPLALEAGLSSRQREHLFASERAALAPTKRIIVTSPATARTLTADYNVPASRITVALPGVDVPARQRAVSHGPPRLLAVGAITPRKGYDILVAALTSLRDTAWSLTIVGATDRSRETVKLLERQIAAAELSSHISLTGAISSDALAELYANADVFVLASHFEGYGMAYAEAIAHGLPVVGTTAGAIPDTVPADAAILVPPGDVAALAAALRRLVTEPAERERLASGAARAASGLPTWQDAALVISNTLEALS